MAANTRPAAVTTEPEPAISLTPRTHLTGIFSSGFRARGVSPGLVSRAPLQAPRFMDVEPVNLGNASMPSGVLHTQSDAAPLPLPDPVAAVLSRFSEACRERVRADGTYQVQTD
jgi:hypothetical protein